MTGHPPTHEPPYPNGDPDPRPWWFRRLEEQVAYKADIQLIVQRLDATERANDGLRDEVRLLRWTLGVGLTAIGAAWAFLSRGGIG